MSDQVYPAFNEKQYQTLLRRLTARVAKLESQRPPAWYSPAPGAGGGASGSGSASQNVIATPGAPITGNTGSLSVQYPNLPVLQTIESEQITPSGITSLGSTNSSLLNTTFPNTTLTSFLSLTPLNPYMGGQTFLVWITGTWAALNLANFVIKIVGSPSTTTYIGGGAFADGAGNFGAVLIGQVPIGTSSDTSITVKLNQFSGSSQTMSSGSGQAGNLQNL